MLSLIFGLLLGAVSVIFALQNVFTVTVTFLAWNITASLALLIVASILIGIIVATLFTLPKSIKDTFAVSKLLKENKKLKDELDAVTIKKENTIETVTSSEHTIL